MTPLERRAVASLSLLYVFRMLGLFMVLPLMALYAADMPDASPSAIGLALGAYGLTQALLQVPLGWLSDRLGRRRIIVAGLLLFIVGSVIAAQAETVADITIGRVLQGAGAIASTVLALVADLTRAEQRTKAMALVGMSIGLSFAVSLVLGPLVASWGGLSAVFWFSALLAVVGVLIVILLVPTPVEAIVTSSTEPQAALAASSTTEGSVWRLSIGVFCLHFVLMASFLVIPSMLEDQAEIVRDRHWLVYLPVMLLSLGGMVPLMILAERKGKPGFAFMTALLAIALALLCIAMLPGREVLLFSLWLFFAGFNYLEATLPSLVSKLASPEAKGAAMGVFSTSQFLGAFCGGAAGGWLVEFRGVHVLLWLCIGLLVVWAVVEARHGAAASLAQSRPAET